MISNSINESIRATFLILMICAIAACNTNPQRETPPPKPRPLYEPQEQSQQQQSQQQQSQQQQSRSQQSQSAQQQDYMPPSEDAAEVEVEEIRIDGEADQQNQQSQRAQSSADRSGNEQRQADSGGASRPQYAEPSSSGAVDPAQSGGMVMLPPGHNTDDEDMIGPNMNVGARTETEQIATLDSELSGQMSDFDERMRRARAAAEAQKMQQAADSSAGMAGGQGQRYDKPRHERGKGGASATSTGLGNTPDLTGETSGRHQQVAVAARPASIPDGRDDDIVARQLREAADKEADPVLREKLWEEYRKYKAGL